MWENCHDFDAEVEAKVAALGREIVPPRRMVYIASPISKGDLAWNIQQATNAFKELAAAGFAPLCPQWSAFSGPVLVSSTGGTVYAIASAGGCGLSHAEWLAVDLVFVARSDAVVRLPGESVGADQEVEYALTHGIPVFDSVEAVVLWARESDAVVAR